MSRIQWRLTEPGSLQCNGDVFSRKFLEMPCFGTAVGPWWLVAFFLYFVLQHLRLETRAGRDTSRVNSPTNSGKLVSCEAASQITVLETNGTHTQAYLLLEGD